MSRHPFAVIPVLLALSGAATAGEPPRVMASIAPIHALCAAVMGETGRPELLVGGGASPHSYSLRPSEARALEKADLVVWVGESLETFLERPLETLAGKARVVELLEVPGLRLIGAPEEEANGKDESHGHHHDHGAIDPHLWLDPGNAALIGHAVAAALSDIDPTNAPSYRANAQALEGRLTELDGELARRLKPLAGKPFVTFHAAYGYLERAYGLTNVGTVTIGPDRQPGARHLADLRRLIVGKGALCLFREPQFPPRLAEALTQGTDIRTGELDPLGNGLAPGPDLYVQLMRRNADALVDCLGD